MPSTPEDQMSDWEALNAYVDGMLPPRQAAEIAGRIAREPDLAKRAAALSRMKASVATSFDTDDFEPQFHEIPQAAAPARKGRTVWRRGFAAAAAMLLIAAGIAYSSFNDPAPSDWVAAAATRHSAMSAQDVPELKPQIHTVTADAGFQPYVPDLAAARLRPVAAAPFPVDHETGNTDSGIILHFRGTRGCKLSYVALMLPGLDSRFGETLQTTTGAGFQGYSWRVGDIGYLLLATDMDSERLAVLAETIHSASRKHRPLNDAARLRLAQSRAESQACAA